MYFARSIFVLERASAFKDTGSQRIYGVSSLYNRQDSKFPYDVLSFRYGKRSAVSTTRTLMWTGVAR